LNYNIEYNINGLFFRIDFLETLTTRCIYKSWKKTVSLVCLLWWHI